MTVCNSTERFEYYMSENLKEVVKNAKHVIKLRPEKQINLYIAEALDYYFPTVPKLNTKKYLSITVH